jgi:hypothetical protein
MLSDQNHSPHQYNLVLDGMKGTECCSYRYGSPRSNAHSFPSHMGEGICGHVPRRSRP